MIYEIKRKDTVVASVRPEGTLTAGIMGEETVSMQFSLTQAVDFHIGDSVRVYGNEYYLAAEPGCEKWSSREFAYQLEFQGIKYELAKVQYFFPDQNNALTRPQFHIVGNARMMLDLLVKNANRLDMGWTLGTVDDTEAKSLDFDGDNCLSALAKIAEAFEVEYWVDGNKSVHLTKRQGVSGYQFEYGKAKGLRSLLREPMQGSNVVTRLYAVGSDKNIPGNYRNASPNLRMAVPFLEKNTDLYGVIEHTQVFDEIYPRRIGTVTAVDASNPLKFTDSGMDFDLNARNANGTTVLINGVSAKVNFLKGQLAGYQFEIKEKGYNSSTKTYTLVKNKNEKHLDVPGEALRPAVGDTYVLTDIIMPQRYIDNAEAELQSETQRYLDENSRQRVQYTLATDPLYFREQNVNIALGLTVRVKDSDFSLNDELRVIRLTKSLSNQYDVQFDVAERAEIAKIVRDYIGAEQRQTALVRTDRYNAELAKRSYNFAREVHDNVFDGEGYFDAERIKPLSIETKMLSVGSRLQQFSLPNVVLTVENNNAVRNTAGQLIHLTLEDTPRTWQLPASVQTGIGNGYHYIYIKAQRHGTNANVLVSQHQIGVEQDSVYYHFEAGSLGSIENGFRRIKTTYGFTQVSPGEITTGRIASPNGGDYIELLQDRINFVGRVTFQADSPALAQTQNLANAAQANAVNQANAHTNSQIDGLQIGGRNLLLDSGKTITNTNYRIHTYVCAEEIKVGETITLSVKADLAPGCYLGLFNGGGNGNEGAVIVDFHLGKTSKTMVWRNNFNLNISKGRGMALYVYGNNTGTKTNTIHWIKLERGNRATDWTPAPEDLQSEMQTKIGEAQSMSKTAWEAYAKAQASNAGAEALATAKAYAQAQDALKENLVKAYADGKVSQAEQKAINVAQAKADLAETKAKAHADGIVTAEEKRAIADAQAKLNQAIAKAEELDKLGNIYIRGTGYNRNASRIIKVSNKIVHDGGGRGLRLDVLGRSGLNVAFSNLYDVYGSAAARTELANKLMSLDMNAIVLLTSFDAINIDTALMNAIHRCGGSIPITNGRYPYALVGIPGIGKGGGLEVRTSDAATAPHAEIETRVINGIPQGINTQYSNIDAQIQSVQSQLAQQIATTRAEALNAQTTANNLAKKTDFLTETSIVGNAVATGTLQVGNSVGANAGITGVGANNTDVRFYAGAKFENRNNAPFRVTQGGMLHAENATIKGKIEAVDGKFTGEINATKGKIGKFNIIGGYLTTSSSEDYNGNNTSNDTWAVNTNHISLSPSLVLFRENGNTRGVVNDVMIGSTGALASDVPYVKVRNSIPKGYAFSPVDNVALSLDAKNATGHNIALLASGNIVAFEDGYVGEAFSNTIVQNIGKTHTYIFTVISRYTYVYLPTKAQIEAANSGRACTFELKIILGKNTMNAIKIEGVVNGYLLDNNANNYSGYNGNIEMARGDTLVLQYCQGNYYIVSHRN